MLRSGRRRGTGLARTMARTALVAGTAQTVAGRVAMRQQAANAKKEAAQGTAAISGMLTDEVVDQLKEARRTARCRRAERQGVFCEEGQAPSLTKTNFGDTAYSGNARRRPFIAMPARTSTSRSVTRPAHSFPANP